MSLDPIIQQMLEKYRNIPISMADKLREILQQIALLGLARHRFFEHAAFYGGTALRILYGLDRFSEDLDFSLFSPDPKFDLNPYLEGVSEEMKSFGFDLTVTQTAKSQVSAVLSAFLKTNTLNLSLSIQDHFNRAGLHPDQKIRVKFEVDTDPPPGFTLETKLVLNPVPFYVTTMESSDLFAGKMHALLCRDLKNRVKGRDWYDFIWFLRQGIALNLDHLRHRMIQTGHLKINDPLDQEILNQRLIEKIDAIDWNNAKADVSPFVANQQQLEQWNASFFKALLAHMKFKNTSS